MIELRSAITDLTLNMHDLEKQLHPLGFVTSDNWDYDHGYIDYQMDDSGEAYHFLRIPYKAIHGEIGSGNPEVQLGQPFLLAHRYESGIEHDGITAYSAVYNQFSAPEEKDAYVDQKYIRDGVLILKEVENRLVH